MSTMEKLPDIGPMARFEMLAAEAGTMEVIAQRVAGGETLRAVCRGWEVPHGRVLQWLMEDEGRWSNYMRALVAAGFARVDEAMEIVDGGAPEDVGRDKLRAEMRRWFASKAAQEYFGDRTRVDTRVTVEFDSAVLGDVTGLLKRLREREVPGTVLPVAGLPEQAPQVGDSGGGEKIVENSVQHDEI